MFQNRGLSTDGIIVRSGRILLIKRGNEPYKNYWALPGGYVEFNETVEQSCKREIKEETGLTVTKMKLLNVYSEPKRHKKQVITISFVLTVTGKPKAGDDAVDVKWFPLKKLPKLAFDHKKIVKDYMSLK